MRRSSSACRPAPFTSPRAACWRASRTKSKRCGCRRTRDMNGPCPPTDELRQLLGAWPADTQSEQLAEHLNHCECCQAKLEELATGGSNLPQLVEQVHQ